MYDVIVIGAGPAGCTAAKALSEKGYKVLLTEKFKLPRYKSCSGQLIKKSLDLVLRYFGEDVPELAMCTPTENRGMIFIDDKGETFRFEQQGLNVWRSSFDNWLAEKAVQFGAEIRDNTTVISAAESDGIVTVTLRGNGDYTEQARYVIDCEGAVGAFKRKLLNIDQQYISTFQTFNAGNVDLDYHYFYAFLQPELSEYDAWFNVKDDQLVLGVAVKDRNNFNHYYTRFISYMEKNYDLKIEKQIKVDKWIMPHIRPDYTIDYGVGRILFAGEIAGFLNPMGEGISSAMESGHCAAVSILNNFENPSVVCTNYKERTTQLHDYMKRQWNLIARMTNTFAEMKCKVITD